MGLLVLDPLARETSMDLVIYEMEGRPRCLPPRVAGPLLTLVMV